MKTKAIFSYLNRKSSEDNEILPQNSEYFQSKKQIIDSFVDEKESSIQKNRVDNRRESIKETHEIKVEWNNFIKMKQRNYLQDYQIIKFLGKGGYGQVNKVKSKYTGLLRAAKVIHKARLNKKDEEKLFSEMVIMKSLDHTNIVRLYEVYDYKAHHVLILQLCEGGELLNVIKTHEDLDEAFIANIIRQILKTLIYLNHKNIIHRDIKLENIIFERSISTIKIIDFGIAFQTKDNEKMTNRVGTPFYMAPEVWTKCYDEKCDIWSLGVVMYALMTRSLPFKGQTIDNIIRNIIHFEPGYSTYTKSIYSRQCLDLLKMMLRKNPKERISATRAFNHPFFKILGKPQEKINEIQIMENIGNFKFKNKLQAVIYTFIVSQVLSHQEKSKLIDIFESIDLNHNGVLDKAQFHKVVKEKTEITQSKINILMRIIDTNNSNQIDLTQFIVASLRMKETFTQQHFQQAFTYFDIDHSGFISYEQIAFFLGNTAQSQEEIKKIFRQIDKNNDGVISQQQLLYLLKPDEKMIVKKIKGRKMS